MQRRLHLDEGGRVGINIVRFYSHELPDARDAEAGVITDGGRAGPLAAHDFNVLTADFGDFRRSALEIPQAPGAGSRLGIGVA